MGDAVETAASTALNIFRLVAHGATDVTNDTVQAIDSIGSTLVDFLTLTGGPLTMVLYIIDLCIIAYLTYRHIRHNRRNRVLQPPPVPEYQNYLNPIL